jgi:FkbM family methyltransferase
MNRLLAWPLSVPFVIADALHRARAVVVDTAHFFQGIATRDAPRAHFLFSTHTRGKSLQMLLTRPGHIEDEIVRSGKWEPHVAGALCFFTRDGGTFVDVGANIGYHALWVARSLPAVHVIAFEPNPFVREDLERNLALNDATNVEIRSCALGDRDGTTTFHAQTGRSYNRGASSILKNPNVGDRYDQISVKLRTLDEEISPDLRVDVIKIDTEGFEAAVLRGARALIARCQPVLVFEFESRFMKDPEDELRRILALLPRYTLWTLGPERPELTRFDPAAVPSRFYRADLVALPEGQNPRD